MNKIFFWLAIASINMLFLYLTFNVCMLFFISFIIAYMLQPVVNFICRISQFPRLLVSSLVFAIFVFTSIILLSILIPLVYSQIALLIIRIPQYFHYIQESFIPIVNDQLSNLDPQISNKISNILNDALNNLLEFISSVVNHTWDYTVKTVGIILFILLVPVLLFYFMRDWNCMIQSIDSVLPLKHKSKINEIIIKIHLLLASYIRGQLNICFLLAAFYSISFTLIGLDFGIIIGIFSGISLIIPFIGVIMSIVISTIVSYFTFSVSIHMLYVLIIYLVGHITESYILSPKIIGNNIGLHPLWILFSIFSMHHLFGILGALFAIPIAGIIKILVTDALKFYKTSRVYNY
ncbi:MAG: AI-2E family transporter [Rickettsiaceae bacterium]